MATVLSVIESGLAMSAMNRAELLATSGVELVRVVERAQDAVFAFMARLNPSLIGATADVSFDGMGWPRPTDADLVYRIEGRGALTTPNTTGEVKVVAWDDLGAATPAVYRNAQSYFSAGKTADPTAGILRFHYAGRPAALSATTDSLDTRLPNAYRAIFEYEVATYLARKDGGRPNDAGVMEQATMAAERDRWLSLLADWCAHETSNETRRFDEVKRIVTEERKPVGLTPAVG